MFCGNCGKEIKAGAGFCPGCGSRLVTCGNRDAEGQTMRAETDTSLKKRFNKKIWIPVILAVCLAAGYFGYQKIVEHTIASEIDSTFALIQNGVDPETAEQLWELAVPQMVDDQMISDFIISNVKGEDVLDIYGAMLRYMEYEVVDVKMVELGRYQAVVRIDNLDNGLVAARAAEIFMERYNTDIFAKIEQGWRDLTSDKSQLIAEMMVQAADEFYAAGDGACWLSREHVITIVKSDGEWTPELDYGALVSSCLGLS